MPEYVVKSTENAPELRADWQDPAWKPAMVGDVKNVWPHDGNLDFIPQVRFRLLHDETALHGIYEVSDHYVKAVHTGFQDNVCQDSCAEFFFAPTPGGYFNLEMNAGANFLIYYVRDCARSGDVFRDYSILTREDCAQISVVSDQPRVIDPEIASPTTWHVQFRLPRTLIEKYSGPLGTWRGRRWHGNFYKCADKTSHPHWIAWNAVTELNFHLPSCFGDIVLM